MKAKLTAILLAANAAWSAIPALADDCGSANMHCQDAVAPVSYSAHGADAMSSKGAAHDTPDVGTHAVGGGDAYKTQSGKREQRDSIDAWYRGG
ncbi:hypothetical protein [Caballeronia ptereochthonis]|uniref:Lipoprotein n=1 Tax=Caballeronia ptereochthonis TaxID=1777144 RepID=A0A157ZH14_9BURK|nr:hypothetical protein [Caballeronia ptereochthonis]SAK44776.1 hypothetical protein AWB83_00576 [Caballeronia ptereochthonis]